MGGVLTARGWTGVALVLLGATSLAGCANAGTSDGATGATTEAPGTNPTAAGPTATTTTAPPAADPTVVAAGDIASCSSDGDEATAMLVAARPEAIVVTLGDNVYDRGRPSEFADCYDRSWGASRSRTRPAPGNHDYATARAAGYFGYFGEAAGDPARGYYSYQVGTWHVVALNSNCTVVSCAAGGDQENWLRADLAGSSSRCVLAYWHHPRFSSGRTHGPATAVGPLWKALYDAGADLVLSGHEHNYERFGPLDPSGRPDPERGVRSFVVGTGGRSHYPFAEPVAGSEVRNDSTYGVLELTLSADHFAWTFVPVAGATFTDSGSSGCH